MGSLLSSNKEGRRETRNTGPKNVPSSLCVPVISARGTDVGELYDDNTRPPYSTLLQRSIPQYITGQ